MVAPWGLQDILNALQWHLCTCLLVLFLVVWAKCQQYQLDRVMKGMMHQCAKLAMHYILTHSVEACHQDYKGVLGLTDLDSLLVLSHAFEQMIHL